MDGHHLINLISIIAGAAIMLLFLSDVFLTILYARAGTSLITKHIVRASWWIVRSLVGRSRHRQTVLSYFGSVIILLLVAVWSFGLSFGSALIFHPYMGSAIHAGHHEETPTDFLSAMFAAANSMTIVGSGDLEPQTPAFRVVYMFNSLIGMCMISLVLTYFMQVYSALLRKNATALSVHLSTKESGDAAELIAGIGPRGDFRDATTWLSERASEITSVKESHHFYSLLAYFRFQEPHYAVARLALVALDAVALIHSALDDEEYQRLKESAAVDDLQRASMRLLVALETTLLPLAEVHDHPAAPDEATKERWRRRYFAGVKRLRQAGLKTTEDDRAGSERYISLRGEWDRYIVAYAQYMTYELTEIDPIGAAPDHTGAQNGLGIAAHSMSGQLHRA